jgi:predicted transcriptional regulator|tara:strand:- start:1172 stop:1477 length:306 start_codon:yes stop_codon:yes gene_type:complete
MKILKITKRQVLILSYINNNPNCSISDLMKLVNMAYCNIHSNISLFLKNGLIVKSFYKNKKHNPSKLKITNKGVIYLNNAIQYFKLMKEALKIKPSLKLKK